MEKTLDENYKALKATIIVCDTDYDRFTQDRVKVSAGRLRGNLLAVKKLCDVVRKQVLEDLKALPSKSRVKKSVVEDPVEEPVVEEPVEEASKTPPPSPIKKVRKKKKTVD
jgi:hypothetical protein